MAEPYLNDAANSLIDKVRLYIGDRSDSVTILTNNEIRVFLEDANDNPLLAAIYACDSLISIYASKVNKKIADQSINYSDMQEHYINLKETLKARYESFGYVVPMPTSGDAEATNRFTSNQFDYV